MHCGVKQGTIKLPNFATSLAAASCTCRLSRNADAHTPYLTHLRSRNLDPTRRYERNELWNKKSAEFFPPGKKIWQKETVLLHHSAAVALIGDVRALRFVVMVRFGEARPDLLQYTKSYTRTLIQGLAVCGCCAWKQPTLCQIDTGGTRARDAVSSGSKAAPPASAENIEAHAWEQCYHPGVLIYRPNASQSQLL